MSEMKRFYEDIVDIFYAMAKEDRYGKPYKEDGVNYLWVHNSSDGWLDQIVVKMDFDNNDFVFETMWSYDDGGPVQTNDFNVFLKAVVKMCEHYKTIDQSKLSKLQKYLNNAE